MKGCGTSAHGTYPLADGAVGDRGHHLLEAAILSLAGSENRPIARRGPGNCAENSLH